MALYETHRELESQRLHLAYFESQGKAEPRFCIAAQYTEQYGYFRKRFLKIHLLKLQKTFLKVYLFEKDRPQFFRVKLEEFGIIFSRIET